MARTITYSSNVSVLNAARTSSFPVSGTYYFTFGPTEPSTPGAIGIRPPDTNYLHSSYPLTNAAFLNAIKMWENAVGVDFQAGISANHINFTYWNTSTGGSGRGAGTTYSTTPNFNTATIFEIFINQNLNQLGAANNAPSFNNWGNWVVAHEIGHTLLGTGHPSDSNAALLGDLRTSIMSNPVAATSNPIPSIPTSIKIPLTPGMNDIETLRTNPAYGASSTRNGNDTYTFTETSINLSASTATTSLGGALSVTGDPGNYVMTIWDGGGTDTIDTSWMTTGNYINLNAGKFSAIGSGINTAPLVGNGGVEYNVGIAIGAQIENVKGSQANDMIVGNALSNELKGNEGNDLIAGNDGSDFLYGGQGNDALNGGANNDYINGGTGGNFLTGGSGTDTFRLDGTHGFLDTSTWWTTITDIQFGENVYLQGWLNGISRQVGGVTQNGAAGYTGATYQFDMDNNGGVDTVITFTGMTSMTTSVLGAELVFA